MSNLNDDKSIHPFAHRVRGHVARRGLLTGSLGLAGAGLLAGGLGATPAGAAPLVGASKAPGASKTPGAYVGASDAEAYAAPTASPLVWQRADPFVTPREDGMYYFTGSVPEYDRVIVRGAPTIEGLGSAAETTIWQRPTTGTMGGHIWAPELHRIDGKWYVYFTAGDAGAPFNIRMYVLESAADDPRDASAWVLRGRIQTPWESFQLDATTFEHRGQRYYLWAAGEPELAGVNSSLYISRMASPLALETYPVRIATPTLPWEVQGFKVNEGPAVIVRGDKVFCTFSASATDSRYCMGLLTADADADLLDPASWVKSPEPIFVTNTETGQYGPGHNSFTVAEDGVTDVMVFHARDYRDIVGDPLYDPNRHARAQRLYWDAAGLPLFGVPVGKGGPIVRLSPANDATSVLRAGTDGVVVAGPAADNVADSQFRTVAGLAGSGTVSLQSVNHPDRYLLVAGAGLRVATVAAGQAGAASWVKTAGWSNGQASSWRSAVGTDQWLRHDKGRISVGAPAGARSTFWLR